MAFWCVQCFSAIDAISISRYQKEGRFMSVKDLLKFAADENAAYVNIRFTDLVGTWHHLPFPIEELRTLD
jgi:hypothetical protein